MQVFHCCCQRVSTVSVLHSKTESYQWDLSFCSYPSKQRPQKIWVGLTMKKVFVSRNTGTQLGQPVHSVGVFTMALLGTENWLVNLQMVCWQDDHIACSELGKLTSKILIFLINFSRTEELQKVFLNDLLSPFLSEKWVISDQIFYAIYAI